MLQVLQTTSAKILGMFGLHARSFTMRPNALRWLLVACMALAFLGAVLAQTVAPKVTLSDQRVQIQQELWIDESQQLDFELARTQNFNPFNPLQRLAIGGKVMWLRLHVAHVGDAADPLFLKLLPIHLGEVRLYSPSDDGQWLARTLAPLDFIQTTRLGAAGQGDDFYLRIHSRHNAAVVAFVGSKDELALHEKKLAVTMAIITTLSLLFLVVMLWRTLRHFSWMSALVCVLLLSTQIQFWLGTGYAVILFGLATETATTLATPNIIANIAIAGAVFIVFCTTVFPRQRWLQWLWTWSLFQMGLCIYALFEPAAASNLSMLTWRIGTLVLAFFLLLAAFREPSSLRQFSNKLAFAVLLLSTAMMIGIAWQSGGVLGRPSKPLTIDLFINNILSRSAMLLVIIGLTSWFYERLKSKEILTIKDALQASQESLGLESKRLERQRKFTAMLAHELKNPLAVSHLALSVIKAGIAQNGPLLKRSAAIEQSLQEIDTIIDRCSEMDGFEQGQLPMRIVSFTLNDLIKAVKASNPSERIYFLVQGISGDAVLVSDIHYLKIIFSNLLSNALKYSPPDTLIELAVQGVHRNGQTRMVAFCVSNEIGEAGVPSPDLAFERFYRAEAARNQSGAGLGLWLSQSLAHALGTDVVMQTQPNKISFTLDLPCK
jgi:signal transduction histidine kinase